MQARREAGSQPKPRPLGVVFYLLASLRPCVVSRFARVYEAPLRFTFHVSRFTFHVLRFTFYVGNTPIRISVIALSKSLPEEDHADEEAEHDKEEEA